MREFKTLTQLYIYISMPLWYINVYPPCHSDIYMYLVYNECHMHSLVSLFSMPLREYIVVYPQYLYNGINVTFICLSSALLSLTLFSMPLCEVFIINATLWCLYHQCKSVMSLSSMPLWYIHVNTVCHSQKSLSRVPLFEYFILNATLWSI